MDKIKLEIDKIYQGDCLEVLKTLPDESIDCCVTSPPYWSLRIYSTGSWEGGSPDCDHLKNPEAFSNKALNKSTIQPCGSTGHAQEGYKDVCGKCGAKRVDKQIGLEKTFNEYINKLIEIFNEVKRVMKPTGTLFVNLGDTYMNNSSMSAGGRQGFGKDKVGMLNKKDTIVQQKSLCQIPSRFAIAMTDRLGFLLRNEIIWKKRNCLPSSCTDRFTVDFEKVFFFTKQKEYFFDNEAVKEDTVTCDNIVRDRDTTKLNNTPGRTRMNGLKENRYSKRNKRCVWDIPTKPLKDLHYASFPDTLITPMILAGCPEFICNKCGTIKRKIYENGERIETGGTRKKDTPNIGNKDENTGYMEKIWNGKYECCDCVDNTFNGGIVLDPFLGSGTSAFVAKQLHRHYIGIELSQEYIKIAEKRIRNELGLFADI
jgi:DNA modification methylase